MHCHIAWLSGLCSGGNRCSSVERIALCKRISKYWNALILQTEDILPWSYNAFLQGCRDKGGKPVQSPGGHGLEGAQARAAAAGRHTLPPIVRRGWGSPLALLADCPGFTLDSILSCTISDCKPTHALTGSLLGWCPKDQQLNWVQLTMQVIRQPSSAQSSG